MHIDYGGKSPLLSSCPLHTHATWEILALISGSGTITFGDSSTERFGPYSVICIPPNTPVIGEIPELLFPGHGFSSSR